MATENHGAAVENARNLLFLRPDEVKKKDSPAMPQLPGFDLDFDPIREG
jgi:hypothetical protein